MKKILIFISLLLFFQTVIAQQHTIVYTYETLYMRDCDLSLELYAEIDLFPYAIIQPPQLSGASLIVSALGSLVYIPPSGNYAIVQDQIIYEIYYLEDFTHHVTQIIIITPCHIAPMSTASTPSLYCLDDTCRYEGPSILINEVMIKPLEYDGAIYGNCSSAQGGEWVELYNPNSCESVDISGYFMANSTKDTPTCSSASAMHNIGAAFVLPEGTIIPPNGFCVLRGERAEVVDSARLVQNGGNTVVIDIVEHFDRFCIDSPGVRFWMPNVGGWFGFYDRNGVPQDAVFWGNPAQDICSYCAPCNPLVPNTYAGALASLDDIPTNRKTQIANFDLNSVAGGNSPKRIPDGGAWQFNVLTPHTQGFCNSNCIFRIDSRCNGTATVNVNRAGNFSYLWNDPNSQTTPTATGLCEGTYCCTVTDEDTQLSELVCVTVAADFVEPDIFFIFDTIFVGEDYNEHGFTIPIQNIGNITIIDSLHYQNDNPCDSIVFLQLTVLCLPQSQYDTMFVSICEGDSYFFNEQNLTLGGIYNDTLISDNGCDSIVTLHLSVRPVPSVMIVEREVCLDDTVHLIFTGVPPFDLDYTFNGTRQSITVSGMDTVLIATQAGENLFITHSLFSGNECGFSNINEQGVEINGVVWATRNVDMPNTFAATPEDYGMLYQWNRNIGWSSTDPMINSNGGNVWDNTVSGTTWEAANDPCSTGWRVPTISEIQSLVGAGSVWTALNGVFGRLFGSGNNTIFLPAAGYRHYNGALFTTFEWGIYWSSSVNIYGMLVVHINTSSPYYSSSVGDYYGYSVRCVQDSIIVQQDTVTVHTTKYSTVSATICDGYSFFFNGNYYNQAGLYNDTLQSSVGCDSIVTLNLTKLNNSYYNYRDTSYKCEWYYFGGDSINETGIYINTLVGRAQNGCDSIITLDLLVRPKEFDDSISICVEKLPIMVYDTLFNVNSISGTYTIHHRCAIITFSLNIAPKVATFPPEIPKICADDDSFILKFPSANVINTKPPTNYEIVFYNQTIPAGFESFENQNGEISNDNEIVVQMPEKIYPDYYSCKIILSDSVYNCISQSFDIVFPVLYPDSIMVQKWGNVIALLNYHYNGGFEFSAYQWFKNGEIMVGRDYSYIYIGEGELFVVGDKYSVLITRPDNSQMFSCDFTAHEPREEYSQFPTLVDGNRGFYVQTKQGGIITIISVSGIVVSKQNFSAGENHIQTPTQQGFYIMIIEEKNQTPIKQILIVK